MPRLTMIPDIDAILTIDPCRRGNMAFASAWQDKKMPVRLMSNIFCHCERGISSAGAAFAIPAQFTAKERAPRFFSADSIALVRSSRRVTSPRSAPAFLPAASMRSTVLVKPLLVSRSKQATVAPASAKPTAMRWPIPLPAPVTIAAFSSKLNKFISLKEFEEFKELQEFKEYEQLLELPSVVRRS